MWVLVVRSHTSENISILFHPPRIERACLSLLGFLKKHHLSEFLLIIIGTPVIWISGGESLAQEELKGRN